MRSTTTFLATAAALCAVGLQGGQAQAATGGPDAFGYTFFDQADGAVYSYVDITVSGTQFQAFGDDVLGALTLSAPFYYYGLDFTNLDVSTNGFITRAAATSSDLGNSCPLPDIDATHPRIEFVHDDLETRIFYQYFDSVAAAGVGYPGTPNGISVIQWTGDHFPDSPPDNVNFEVILFHGSNQILMLHAADPETGSGSTTGLSDPVSGASLTYACNVAGTLTPGVTAIRWVAPCGDGAVGTGEDCDDVGESATCDFDCTAAVCGDATLNATAGEACDDGGESPTCNADCSPAVCGDGVLNVAAGEECDDAGESAACDADCTFAMCGDTNVNVTAGEDCDDGAESATCDADCTAVACGDGTLNATASEECDDGGESATCDVDCTAASCGDMTVNNTAGETCDDGMRTESCNADCTATTCGDGVLNMAAGEECDDMGESATCDDDCTNAMCGDGTTNATAGEECDDGNSDDGDGCAADCTTEDEPGTTGDTGDTEGVDSTAGDTEGVDSTGGEGSTSGNPPPPTTVTDGSTSGDDESSGGEVPPDDSGCSCTTGEDSERGAAWSMLALLGLVGLRRRRRAA